ncbi:MAG: NUDIX domain-containing protein [Gemmatimonadaceae bacterium]
MHLDPSVFDVWAFRRSPNGAEFLLLYTSQEKADRHFNAGRFWQIPSGFVREDETIVAAVQRELALYGLLPTTIWAGEHAYLIYNRRFATMQAIGVYAAAVADVPVRLEPSEHSEYAWCSYEQALERVHYRGLKDGLRSVDEYVTGASHPARELCLYEERDERSHGA